MNVTVADDHSDHYEIQAEITDANATYTRFNFELNEQTNTSNNDDGRGDRGTMEHGAQWNNLIFFHVLTCLCYLLIELDVQMWLDIQCCI